MKVFSYDKTIRENGGPKRRITKLEKLPGEFKDNEISVILTSEVEFLEGHNKTEPQMILLSKNGVKKLIYDLTLIIN